MEELIYLPEPPLLFNFDQPMTDPRDGLTLFGPLDEAKPAGIRWAVVGLPESIYRLKKWITKIQRPVFDPRLVVSRPMFPGFEEAFGTKLPNIPALEIPIDPDHLDNAIRLSDKHQRVYRTVELFTSVIVEARRSEDTSVDLWFIVITEDVYKYCRPESKVEKELRIEPEFKMKPKTAKELSRAPSLFPEDNELAQLYQYGVNFHHQLKARLLHYSVPTQIVRETTIAPHDFLNQLGNPIRKIDDESTIAWNLSSAVFYKIGGRPWKLGSARDGVCYIGLTYKQINSDPIAQTACCAAQMFLDSGDGLVFRGAVGPWYREKKGDYHLSHLAAKELVELCVEGYKSKSGGASPKEVFIHGKVAFNNEEWNGFCDGVGVETKVVGIQITAIGDIKLYRLGRYPILRGTAYVLDERRAFLWTKGFIPRLRTYPGFEVPLPIRIEIRRGDADIDLVLKDVFALTKLNYNACKHGDGLPITLRFADAVGEILTSGPARKMNVPPLPFKYYI